jgi:hypothetical protein
MVNGATDAKMDRTFGYECKASKAKTKGSGQPNEVNEAVSKMQS